MPPNAHVYPKRASDLNATPNRPRHSEAPHGDLPARRYSAEAQSVVVLSIALLAGVSIGLLAAGVVR